MQFAEMQKIPGLLAAIGLPDIHAGYLFPIGSVAAIDLSDPLAGISPEGVGFDINCGVRCLRTNLMMKDLECNMELKNKLADLIFDKVPSGMGGTSPLIDLNALNAILNRGMKHLVESGYIPEDDLLYTEDGGSLPGNSGVVGQKAKSKGAAQLGSLGSGNHYLEIQVVEKIFDTEKARVLEITEGQILISIHTGSRGLGHSICQTFLGDIEKECLLNNNNSIGYHSEMGKKYISLMNSASNFAWANRSVITQKVREAFREVLPHSKIDLIYDTCHNIAKIETYNIGGQEKLVLVHRKGASRILPPDHEALPPKYKSVGQPVLVGGSMGTSSYILAGTSQCGQTFNSTCHGAGRVLTRGDAKKAFSYESVEEDLNEKGIIFRCGSRLGLIEEACGCYKDVDRVVEHSDKIGITNIVARVKPVIVIKG